MKKRGLSDLVVTVLIILIALAATVVVWSFLLPSFEGTGGKIEDQTTCLNIEVEPKSCQLASGQVQVILQARGEGVDGAIAVVKMSDGSTKSARVEEIFEAYVTKVVGVNSEGLTPVSAQAAALVRSANGELVTCPVNVKEISCDGCETNSDCDDGEECTIDTCNTAISQCEYDTTLNNGNICDDGLYCTNTDVCNVGACSGSGNTCPTTGCNEAVDLCYECDGNEDCSGSLVCVDHECVSGGGGGGGCTAGSCDALDSFCADYSCNAGTGNCDMVPLLEDQPCDDGLDWCTVGERCHSGLCGLNLGDPGASAPCVSSSGVNCDDNAQVCTCGEGGSGDCFFGESCIGGVCVFNQDLVVFVTSGSWRGDSLGGVTGADAKCQAAADSGIVPSGTYKAWISNQNTDAIDRIKKTAGNYILPDGNIVANGWNDTGLTSGNLLIPINMMENGLNIPGPFPPSVPVITGTGPSGIKSPGTDGVEFGYCISDWNNFGATSHYTYGNARSTNPGWTEVANNGACDSTSGRLYCFQVSI